LTDAGGEVRWAASHTASGQISKLHVNRVDNPVRLQGQYEDSETGLHYSRFRYYEPSSEQFANQDPLGLWPGENLYWYALNPFSWIDPLGLQCKKGVVYRRTNPKTGKQYIGKSKDDKNFLRRQKAHDRRHGVKHKYEVIENAEPGDNLAKAEEDWIRKGGGPETQGGPLENRRYEMNPGRYAGAGGTEPKPT
jgi:RHS repeat-associated protein